MQAKANPRFRYTPFATVPAVISGTDREDELFLGFEEEEDGTCATAAAASVHIKKIKARQNLMLPCYVRLVGLWGVAYSKRCAFATFRVGIFALNYKESREKARGDFDLRSRELRNLRS